jgi:hypothetical protein
MLDCKAMATPMVSTLKLSIGYDFIDCGCYFIQEYGGFVDVLNEHETRYMFCCEHPELVYGAA